MAGPAVCEGIPMLHGRVLPHRKVNNSSVNVSGMVGPLRNRMTGQFAAIMKTLLNIYD
jgi:hypothetical protein